MGKDEFKNQLKNFASGLAKFIAYTFILMLLWNRLMPKFFGLLEITYLEALMFHIFINLVNRDRTPKKAPN